MAEACQEHLTPSIQPPSLLLLILLLPLQICHGDLKPGNILVDRDMQVYISDFGLASMQVQAKCISREETCFVC
jgi:serine/threonine protein kinase